MEVSPTFGSLLQPVRLSFTTPDESMLLRSPKGSRRRASLPAEVESAYFSAADEREACLHLRMDGEGGSTSSDPAHHFLTDDSPVHECPGFLRDRYSSLQRRECEISVATGEALKQVKLVIQQTQQWEGTIAKLHGEVDSLLREVARLQQALLESNMLLQEKDRYQHELQRQLFECRQKLAETRMSEERLKLRYTLLEEEKGVQNFPGPPCLEEQQELLMAPPYEFSSTDIELRRIQQDYHALVDDHERMKQEMHRLKLENQNLADLVAEMDQQKDVDVVPSPPRERQTKKSHDAAGEYSEEQQAVSETRSIKELLGQIRQLMTEKVVWENYACSLVRDIVRGMAPNVELLNVLHTHSATPRSASCLKKTERPLSKSGSSRATTKEVQFASPKHLSPKKDKVTLMRNDGPDCHLSYSVV